MGQRASKNFKKRFGDPPRITVSYLKKPLSAVEKNIQSTKIREVFTLILSEQLKRPPTEAELLGCVDLQKELKKKS